MDVNAGVADKYQDFFNFMSREHNLILTIDEMNEIVLEAEKLERNIRMSKSFYCNDSENMKFGIMERCVNQCDECKLYEQQDENTN